jgi:ABC-type glycerol-3-phosphate transport system permease component
MTTRREASFTNRLTAHFASYGSLILVGLLISIPLAWFVITSFKPQEEYMSYPVRFFPRELFLDTYRSALTMIDYFRFAGHSVILSLTHTTLTVITSAMAGFAFARFNVPGRNKLFVIVIAMLIVPVIILQIPQFIIFSKLGLTGTWWPWVLWGLAASPFFIFLFRQFFAAFPKELEDAAEIDGCGPFRTFVSVFLPNSKAVLATAFILNFTAQWGDYINPFLFLKDSNTTLAVKLQTGYLSPQGQTLTTIILAAAVLYVLPVVIIFSWGRSTSWRVW